MHNAFSNMKNLNEFIFMLCCLRAQSHDCRAVRTIKTLVFTERLLPESIPQRSTAVDLTTPVRIVLHLL